MSLSMHRSLAKTRRLVLSGAAAALALLVPVSSHAQEVISARDSTGRVFRFQLRQRMDTSYVRTLRTARLQLQARLDSLQHEFEGLSLQSPDRLPRLRELTAMLSSLGTLSELEHEASARFEAGATLMRERLRTMPEPRALPMPPRSPDAAFLPGWIGINVEAPHQRIVRGDTSFIRYFSYPEIVSVEPSSPAERVGISRGDRLLAYDGADVREHEINLTRLLQPARRILVTVRRDGEEREFPVTVAKAPPRLLERRMLSVPDNPSAAVELGEGIVIVPRGGSRVRAPTARAMVFGNMDASSAPVAGANLSEIDDEAFGHIFGVSTGVLVTEVFSDPARSSGLRGGDVIRRADGRDVSRIAQLRRIVAEHNADREVELEIVRQKRARTIMLRW
jgi:hypothetical protein